MVDWKLERVSRIYQLRTLLWALSFTLQRLFRLYTRKYGEIKLKCIGSCSGPEPRGYKQVNVYIALHCDVSCVLWAPWTPIWKFVTCTSELIFKSILKYR